MSAESYPLSDCITEHNLRRLVGKQRSRGDRSELVEVFLWEHNYEQAWDEAIAGGCSAYLWLEQADRIA